MSSTRRTSVRAKLLIATAIAASFNKVYAQTTSFLSIDINGGFIGGPTLSGGQNCTNLGWGSFAGDTSFGPHQVGGFDWTPWGGPGANTLQPNGSPNNQGGDDIQLPITGGGAPAGNYGGYPAASINKTFTGVSAVPGGQVTVTLSSPGGATNNPINSRDRGWGGGTTNFTDMYRDFVFVARNTGLQNGGSPLQVTLSNLEANTTYTVTTFAYDGGVTPNMGLSAQFVFGSINPIPFDYAPAAEQVEGNGQFANPPDPLDGSLVGPRISAGAAALLSATSPYQFASTWQFTTDNNGNYTFFEYTNNGGSNVLQGAAVLSGLQIGSVAGSTWTAASSANWGSGFSPSVPDGDHAVAIFPSIAAPQTVTVEGAGRTVGIMNLTSNSAYTFSGGTLTFNDSFAPDPNLPPPSGPLTTSSTTGHAQINVSGDAAFNVTHVINSPVVLNQQTTVSTRQAQTNLTIGGGISGSKGLNKMGTGALVLSAANSYGGTTNVLGGRLIVNGQHTGGGNYTVIEAATLGGSGTLSLRDDITPRNGTAPEPGKLTVWNGGTIAPGNVGTIGTFTLDRLAIGSPAPHGSGSINLAFDLGSGGADRLNVTDAGGGTLDAVYFTNAAGTANFTFTDIGGIAAGIYTILDYNGSLRDMNGVALTDINRFVLTTPTLGGFSLGLVNNTANTSIDLQVVVAGPSSWTGAVDANWNVAGNWTGLIPNGTDSTANFFPNTNDRYSVNVDGAKTVGTLNLDGPTPYTLSGSTITFQATNGAPQLLVGSGNHTIASPIAANNFLFINVPGGSSLNITGEVRTNVSSRQISKSGDGLVQFNRVLITDTAVTPNIGVGTLLVNAGTARISAKGTVGDPAGTTRVGSLNIAAGATVDLTNNFLIADSTPSATIRGHLATGFSTGAWNGTGISSASAAAVAANAGNTHKTSLGYAVASQINDFGTNPSFSFGGLTINSPASVVVRYTLSGDGNLDGAVTTADFNQLALNFNGTGKEWFQGDFNYDGIVNALDFNAIATNFGSTPTPGPALGALVPEPASLTMLGAALLLTARRRRSG